MPLSGKTALVTGASAGIGRATAIALAQAGAKILATGRRRTQLDALKQQCGSAVEIIAGDLNDGRFVDELASAARDVDLFVNNAGVLKYAPLLDMTDADCEAMFRTNVIASFRITHRVAKSMVERRRGYIIVMTSIAAREVYRLGVMYCATKHALSAFARGLRIELQGSIPRSAPTAFTRACWRRWLPESSRLSPRPKWRKQSCMRRRPRPTAVPISSSCGRKGRPDEFLLEEHLRNERPIEINNGSQAMAKTIAKLQAQARKTSSKTPTRKRASGTKSAARAKSKAKTKARPKQTFNVSHFRAEDFRADGLRSYARYRDLGMSKATNGLLQAHVIRLVPPCNLKVVSKRHYHDVDLQMIYVLKGWIKGEYDGEVVTMHEGAAWLQPPRIKHSVLDYSDDCELLEIITPADFETVELE